MDPSESWVYQHKRINLFNIKAKDTSFLVGTLFSFFPNNILHVAVCSFLFYSFDMQQSLKFCECELIPVVNFGFFLSILHVIIFSFLLLQTSYVLLLSPILYSILFFFCFTCSRTWGVLWQWLWLFVKHLNKKFFFTFYVFFPPQNEINVLINGTTTFEFFRIEFYRIYRIGRKLFLVVLKMKITNNSLLQIL